MPAYNYKCQKCGEIIEVRHGMKETYNDACAACGGKMKKLIGAGTGVIFKGSGFYCTDFKNKSGGGASEKPCCANCPNKG